MGFKACRGVCTMGLEFRDAGLGSEVCTGVYIWCKVLGLV